MAGRARRGLLGRRAAPRRLPDAGARLNRARAPSRATCVWRRWIEDALPAYLTIILIPLAFPITQGILCGFIAHAGLHTPAGRAREVGPVMCALALVSVGLLPLERFA